MANMKKYRVNWQVDSIGGKVRNAGDYVEVADEEAAPLVQMGALSPVKQAEPPKPADPSKDDGKGDGKSGDKK